MTRCKKCGKTGLFHRIEKDTGLCRRYGSYLIELHKRYNLEPSQELLDLIETYEDKR